MFVLFQRNDALDLNLKAEIIDYSPSDLNGIPNEIVKLAERLSISKAGQELKNKFENEINKIKNSTQNELIDLEFLLWNG